MTKNNEKIYVVHKFVRATSAYDAIVNEKKHKPDEVYIDEDKSSKLQENKGKMGFN